MTYPVAASESCWWMVAQIFTDGILPPTHGYFVLASKSCNADLHIDCQYSETCQRFQPRKWFSVFFRQSLYYLYCITGSQEPCRSYAIFSAGHYSKCELYLTDRNFDCNVSSVLQLQNFIGSRFIGGRCNSQLGTAA